MERSESINELAAALSRAQAEFNNILKSQTAQIRTKAGATYSYSYADLASLLDMVRTPLSKNALAIVQCSNTASEEKFNSEGKNVTVVTLLIETMLLHSSGQYIKNQLKLPVVDTGNNAIQAIGSSITYGRRYEVSSILGIASEEDDDANIVPRKEPSKTVYPPPPLVQLHQSTEGAAVPKTMTLRGMIEKLAIEKFGSLDKFQVWRIENNLPESLEGMKDFDLAKVMTAVREHKAVK